MYSHGGGSGGKTAWTPARPLESSPFYLMFSVKQVMSTSPDPRGGKTDSISLVDFLQSPLAKGMGTGRREPFGAIPVASSQPRKLSSHG